METWSVTAGPSSKGGRVEMAQNIMDTENKRCQVEAGDLRFGT